MIEFKYTSSKSIKNVKSGLSTKQYTSVIDLTDKDKNGENIPSLVTCSESDIDKKIEKLESDLLAVKHELYNDKCEKKCCLCIIQ